MSIRTPHGNKAVIAKITPAELGVWDDVGEITHGTEESRTARLITPEIVLASMAVAPAARRQGMLARPQRVQTNAGEVALCGSSHPLEAGWPTQPLSKLPPSLLASSERADDHSGGAPLVRARVGFYLSAKRCPGSRFGANTPFPSTPPPTAYEQRESAFSLRKHFSARNNAIINYPELGRLYLLNAQGHS
jgi:hypothetical protein